MTDMVAAADGTPTVVVDDLVSRARKWGIVVKKRRLWPWNGTRHEMFA
jgi:hypothetical protein